jgi:hypothetical protein
MKNLFKTLLMAVFLANLLALPVFKAQAGADFSGSNYSETDASNTNASPNGWPSGSYFSQVEPNMRAQLGGLKRWFNRINCTVTSGGSANAYTYTPVNTSYPIAYNTGDDYCFIANFANTGATTENVNSLGVKNLYKIGTSGVTALTGGEIQIGQPVLETYDGTEFVMLSPTANSAGGTVSSVTFTGDGTVLSSTPSSAVTISGTITGSLITQTANTVLAGPTSGSAANPTFRSIVAADLPAATTGALGAVSTDGSTISNSSGAIACTTATTSQKGCVKPDGTTITISSGTISASTGQMTALGVGSIALGYCNTICVAGTTYTGGSYIITDAGGAATGDNISGQTWRALSSTSSGGSSHIIIFQRTN